MTITTSVPLVFVLLGCAAWVTALEVGVSAAEGGL